MMRHFAAAGLVGVWAGAASVFVHADRGVVAGVVVVAFLIGLFASAAAEDIRGVRRRLGALEARTPLPERLDNIDGRSVLVEWELGDLDDERFLEELAQVLRHHPQRPS